jgi:hypothetical protein
VGHATSQNGSLCPESHPASSPARRSLGAARCESPGDAVSAAALLAVLPESGALAQPVARTPTEIPKPTIAPKSFDDMSQTSFAVEGVAVRGDVMNQNNVNDIVSNIDTHVLGVSAVRVLRPKPLRHSVAPAEGAYERRVAVGVDVATVGERGVRGARVAASTSE